MIWGTSVTGGICVVLMSFAVFKRFTGGMSLAGCCTASIAAAYQLQRKPGNPSTAQGKFLPDLAKQKLKWGEVLALSEGHNGIGHATFTDGIVIPLEKGKVYN